MVTGGKACVLFIDQSSRRVEEVVLAVMNNHVREIHWPDGGVLEQVVKGQLL